MDSDKFIISDFLNVTLIHDKKGRKVTISNRYSSVIIAPVYGYYLFHQDGNTTAADNCHPIFIPKGSTYVNECVETADSMLFNFQTMEDYSQIQPLPYLKTSEFRYHFNMLEELWEKQSPGIKQAELTEIYSLLYKIFASENIRSSVEIMLAPAIEMIHSNYNNPGITCKDIAKSIHISEVYLRKLFHKSYAMTPGQYLNKVRMEKARNLTFEKRSVKNIAIAVGYSDVYQFSRAYKKYFGYSPTKNI